MRHLPQHPLTGAAIVPLGYRADGRPIFPIMGGAPPVDDTPPVVVAPPAETPPGLSQEKVNEIAAREKSVGERQGKKALAESLGFESVEALETAVRAQKERDAANLTETERRQAELDEREKQTTAREATAAAREFQADLRSALIERGVSRGDLGDGAVLLAAGIGDDRSETAVGEAADKLKERRPELFAASGTPTPPERRPAPAGVPAGKPPATNQPPGATYGAKGLAEAERRFPKKTQR